MQKVNNKLGHFVIHTADTRLSLLIFIRMNKKKYSKTEKQIRYNFQL